MAIVEAVTGVLVCDDEFYLARRQPFLTAFPGFNAFPGGKVDIDERQDALPHPLLAGFTPRHVQALIRELREELAFDLHAELARDNVLDIAHLGAAISPSFVANRFDTQFFRIVLRDRPMLTLDPGEVADGGWATAADWLAGYARGELLLAPPTLEVITALAQDLGTAAVPSLARFEHFDGIPWLEPLCGVVQLPVRSNTLPPADRTNCFLIGDAAVPRLLIDPSPANAEELERLLALLEHERITEVFLTHHHPDHRQFANEIARHRNLPMAMSADTHARIAGKQPTYFDGIRVCHRDDGDVVTQWLGHAVRVIAVPGHDEGQLALMPDNRAFCIVGDLIQGIGTVVIAAPEGDMAKYFASLERIIELSPRVIWPSHGSALGGVHYLEQALAHRRARETAIKTLRDAAKTLDEIVAALYEGLDPRLLPLARTTVESHLAKLRQESAAATAR